MRFKLIFDKDLISNHFVKSWFVVEQQASCTLEIIKKIAGTFGISCDIHLELEEFLIPEQQIFEKIVQEGEIVNVRKGKIPIFSQQAYIKTEGFEQNKANGLDLRKSAKKVAKDEDSSSSEGILVKKRKSSSSESILISGKKPLFLSESEDSSSEKKPKSAAKPPQTRVPIKSMLKVQPEPEFIKKPIYEFEVQDFVNCSPHDLEVSDEIIYKTLEIRDDNTPGLSDHKLGRVLEVAGEQVTIQLIREGLQEEFNKLDETEVFDELYLENFRVTLGKSILIDLMKKSQKIHT